MSFSAPIAARLGHPRILVFGDIMLDRYTWGNAGRVSPGAPVLVLRADFEEVRLGGAASVAGLLIGLEASVCLVGVVGDDASGRVLRKLFDESGIDASAVMTIPDRPTTSKERFMGRAAGRHPHQMLRVDHEDCQPLDAGQEETLLTRMRVGLEQFDAILISDYAKGCCTTSYRPHVSCQFRYSSTRPESQTLSGIVGPCC